MFNNDLHTSSLKVHDTVAFFAVKYILPVSLLFFLGERKPCVLISTGQGLVDDKASVDEAQVGIDDAKLVAGP